MKLISNQEFIETYHPICNDRFPTTLLQGSLLHLFAFQKDEYALIAEYIRPQRFFTIETTSVGEYVVYPGLRSSSARVGHIITECPWRTENLEYTIVEFLS